MRSSFGIAVHRPLGAATSPTSSSADPAAPASLEQFTKAAAPILSALTEKDATESVEVLRAKIRNMKDLRDKFGEPIKTFYRNEVRKLEARLRAATERQALQREDVASTREWSRLGKAATLTGIAAGGALILVLLAGAGAIRSRQNPRRGSGGALAVGLAGVALAPWAMRRLRARGDLSGPGQTRRRRRGARTRTVAGYGDALSDVVGAASLEMQQQAAGYSLGQPVRTTAEAGQAARLAFRSGASESPKYAGNLKSLAANVGYEWWKTGRTIDEILSNAYTALANSNAPRAAKVIAGIRSEYKRNVQGSASSSSSSSSSSRRRASAPAADVPTYSPAEAAPNPILAKLPGFDLATYAPWFAVGAVTIAGVALLWPRRQAVAYA